MASSLIVVIVVLAGVIVGQQYLHYQLSLRWLRMLAEKQGLPAVALEAKPAPEPTPIPERPRHRISIPVPGGAPFRVKQ